MAIAPGTLDSRFTWTDKSGELRINFEAAWEAMRAEFMQIAAAESLNVEEHQTVRLFKDRSTRERYYAHQQSWHARNLA